MHLDAFVALFHNDPITATTAGVLGALALAGVVAATLVGIHTAREYVTGQRHRRARDGRRARRSQRL